MQPGAQVGEGRLPEASDSRDKQWTHCVHSRPTSHPLPPTGLGKSPRSPTICRWGKLRRELMSDPTARSWAQCPSANTEVSMASVRGHASPSQVQGGQGLGSTDVTAWTPAQVGRQKGWLMTGEKQEGPLDLAAWVALGLQHSAVDGWVVKCGHGEAGPLRGRPGRPEPVLVSQECDQGQKTHHAVASAGGLSHTKQPGIHRAIPGPSCCYWFSHHCPWHPHHLPGRQGGEGQWASQNQSLP